MAATLFPGVVLITGAAGTGEGIGAAVARAFAEAGCTRIAVTDLNEGLLEDTSKFIVRNHPSVNILAVAGDVSNEIFVGEFVESVVRHFGRLDYAVNCAGILGNNQGSADTSLEDFDKINAVNYPTGNDAVRGSQRGSIVNIASQLGIVGRPAAPAYSASKAAVIALTRADAIDYSANDIRVNCICPGIIETPMTACDESRLELIRPSINIAPMRRMGKPEEIADCALFLSSTRASFVQGHAMVVDGGYTIN